MTSSCIFADLLATFPRRGILRRNSDPPTPRRDLAVYFDRFDVNSTVSVELPANDDEKGSVGSIPRDEMLIPGTTSPSSVRAGSKLGLRSPVCGRYPLPTSEGNTVDDATSTVSVELNKQRSGDVEMIEQINEHIREWSLSGDSTYSDDTRSTWPIPRSTSTAPETHSTSPSAYEYIRRNQKNEPKDTNRLRSPGREFTSAEIAWLDYVVNELYVLIVGKALDPKAGVQYRSTFAWNFQVQTAFRWKEINE